MSRWDPFEDDGPLMGMLSKKAAKEGFSLAGMVNLTAHCNLKCLHCYITPSCKKYPVELSTDDFKRIFDEIADMGTLYLTMTGGEPLMRPDFKELYSYARRCGFILSLFSNATLINNDIISLLKDLPPRHVDISIYGATEEAYESITGVKGSYRRCLDGIELLLKNDIKVRLKTVLMKQNIADFDTLREMVADYDVPYRVDSMIFGRFSGDKAPLDLRVSPEQGVECEVQIDKHKESIKRLLEYDSDFFLSDKLYNCGAGIHTFSVTETGMLRPCLMIADIESDLKKDSFKSAWRQVRDELFSLKAIKESKCKGCDMYNICGYCPPMGKLASYENGDEREYFCKIGKARKNSIDKL